MKIQLVNVGKFSAKTKGPYWGIYFEMLSDGLHCNVAQMGAFLPAFAPPVYPGYCLYGP